MRMKGVNGQDEKGAGSGMSSAKIVKLQLLRGCFTADAWLWSNLRNPFYNIHQVADMQPDFSMYKPASLLQDLCPREIITV